MALSDAWPLQQSVFSAITTALADAGETIEIYDHVPTNAPREHIRLHGFDVRDDSWKDTERGRHPVMIGFYTKHADSSTPIARGQSRIHAVNSIIHGALKDLRHNGGRMQFEMSDVEMDDDGVTGRGTLRYTIII